jgi:hypothetical protein
MTVSSHTNIADYYFSFPENLGSNNKRDLIAKLSQSIEEGKRTSEI